ncbi:MAG: hypothetical protein R2939_07565 [Kofleriaceae bacterium]
MDEPRRPRARRHGQRLEGGDADAAWEIRRLLESGVQSACCMVFGMAQLDPDKKGMSTTCSAMLIRARIAFAARQPACTGSATARCCS